MDIPRREIVVLLGSISGLIISKSGSLSGKCPWDDLWNFALLGLAVGPYVIFFALVRASIVF
jgi:hypothetical protein